MTYQQIGIIADNSKKAREALEELSVKYGLINLEQVNMAHIEDEVDAIVVLGGDGFMLRTLHEFMDIGLPFYGLNCGTVGFLLNKFNDEEDLLTRIEKAEKTIIHPLTMEAVSEDGTEHEASAINEVSLLRQTRQTADIRIVVNGEIRVDKLMCDGVLLSTPAGSSAYNFSAGGPIIPVNANVLALTPISPFRPRRWKGALLPHTVTVTFEILQSHKRPVSAVADFTEVRRVKRVTVFEDRTRELCLLFDPGHSLEERIITEQFVL